MKILNYSRVTERVSIPDLTEMQVNSYKRFLQMDVPPRSRENFGLEAIIREVFPIQSHDNSISLEYLWYELGRPRYSPSECKKLKLTYGAPFKLRLRLQKNEPIEEYVYLGDIPLMLGGGEFIINGATRVIVSQIQRSPGVDFSEEVVGEKKLHSCIVLPERGSRLEFSVSKRDMLYIRIDQASRIPLITFLRALDPMFSRTVEILKTFYPVNEIQLSGDYSNKLIGKIAAQDIIASETDELILEGGGLIDDKVLTRISKAKVKVVQVIDVSEDRLIYNSLQEDNTKSHEEALLRIYERLRPASPPSHDKARSAFHGRLFDPQRYRLGKVGRFRLDRKFYKLEKSTLMCSCKQCAGGCGHTDVYPVPYQDEGITGKCSYCGHTSRLLPSSVLSVHDVIQCIRFIMRLRKGERAILDDIDHLGNRRVRMIDELAGEEIRKGFLKLRRGVIERLNYEPLETMTPRQVVNAKTVSAAIEYFFGRSGLSQVVDQTNPLSQLTHERRLSALGPGGLNRKRASFDVRDVHISHYGRICPIETPEGTNIGLISSLGIYSRLDEYGFLTTPYRVVRNGKVTSEIVWLRADAELDKVMVPADTPVAKDGTLLADRILARVNGDFLYVSPKEVHYMDVSPEQIVGVSASLIPFLEHNDANRALMGSNMQRQAVPLLRPEPPLIFTGMERVVAENTSMVLKAPRDGVVTHASSSEIAIDGETFPLEKFVGLNEHTCLTQKPLVRKGQRVKRGEILSEGAATAGGELALGRNVLVAFMPWLGYNFEDAIVVSESLIHSDAYCSVHIEEFEAEIRETKLGREEFTRDIPNVSERALRNLDENGVVHVGTKVGPGDILVGKVAPKTKVELTPEEKLLHAIFGKAGEDVKNDSLEVPSGIEGYVISAQRFSRRVLLTESDRKRISIATRKLQKEFYHEASVRIYSTMKELKAILDKSVHEILGRQIPAVVTNARELEQTKELISELTNKIRGRNKQEKALAVIRELLDELDRKENELERKIAHLTRGDDLPPGVLETVKLEIATKRNLSVGDKMAGRHGNKGVIAKILPIEDMPFLEDGTPVEMILNPLGVPSRMNIGQILETHLGWAASKLGCRIMVPPFDGPEEADIENCLKQAGIPTDGKVTLYDGRTGEPFAEKVTVGMIYMMKLHHLVDDKIHARATGPYSLITQQPLGGKARFGGQRFGEMEVWAIEAYGAANILQELLTVKSDDVDGRNRIYESMIKGECALEPARPASLDVLLSEIRGLGLNIKLEKKKRI